MLIKFDWSFIPVGVRYMVMSASGFAMMGVFVKQLSADGIPILQIVAARALVSLVLSYLDVRRKKKPLFGQRKILLCIRAIVGTVTLFFVYYSIASLPFAEATVLQYLYPIFTAFLAVVLLKEHLKLPTVLCVLLSFSGLLFIVRPEFLFGGLTASYDLRAISAAVLGAFGTALAYILVRKLNKTEDASVIIFYFPLFALPTSLALLGNNFVMPEGIEWLLLLLVGVMTQVGQIGVTKAMQTETASRATSFSYLQVVFAIVLGWLVFSEYPSLWVYLGTGLIVAGASVNLFMGANTEKLRS